MCCFIPTAFNDHNQRTGRNNARIKGYLMVVYIEWLGYDYQEVFNYKEGQLNRHINEVNVGQHAKTRDLGLVVPKSSTRKRFYSLKGKSPFFGKRCILRIVFASFFAIGKRCILCRRRKIKKMIMAFT